MFFSLKFIAKTSVSAISEFRNFTDSQKHSNFNEEKNWFIFNMKKSEKFE